LIYQSPGTPKQPDETGFPDILTSSSANPDIVEVTSAQMDYSWGQTGTESDVRNTTARVWTFATALTLDPDKTLNGLTLAIYDEDSWKTRTAILYAACADSAAPNVPPTADAGGDQNVTDSDDNGTEDVTLDGSGSSDSDGAIVSYVWEENSSQIATGVSPVVTLSVAVHTIDLTVTDDDDATDTDSVVVTVNAYVGGSVYYLDIVNGDDITGDGSSGSPWQTLAKAQAVGVAGDTFILAAGNYGPFEERADATGGWDIRSDWVTYKAAEGADVDLESILISYIGSLPPDPLQEGAFDAYLRFEDIDILDGVNCQSARHWALVGCLIERYGPWTGSVANIEKTAVNWRCGTDILIENCEITNTGTAIAGRGHDVRILNNYIHDGAHDGIRVTGFWDSLIEGNTICRFDDGVTDAEEPTWSRHCDLIHIFIPGPGPEGWQNHNVTFRNNILYDTEAQIVQFNNYYASSTTRIPSTG